MWCFTKRTESPSLCCSVKQGYPAVRFGTVWVSACERRLAGWSLTTGWKPADCTAKPAADSRSLWERFLSPTHWCGSNMQRQTCSTDTVAHAHNYSSMHEYLKSNPVRERWRRNTLILLTISHIKQQLVFYIRHTCRIYELRYTSCMFPKLSVSCFVCSVFLLSCRSLFSQETHCRKSTGVNKTNDSCFCLGFCYGARWFTAAVNVETPLCLLTVVKMCEKGLK